MKVIQNYILTSNFIYEIKIHKHLENIWIYKAKQFIVEDSASGEQVGDIEKIIVKNLFKI